MSLNELAREIHETSKGKGFWPRSGRDPLSVLMLIVSEVAEAAEDFRDGKMGRVWSYKSTDESRANMEGYGVHVNPDGDEKNYIVSLTFSENRREMTHELMLELGYEAKPTGLPSEMADIVIRALDACAAWGIDIERAVEEKMRYNKTRPHMHGRRA